MKFLGLRALIAAGLTSGLLLTSVPTGAQEVDERRIRKIEQEVRALQRKVFPGSDGRFFEPEIAPNQPTAPQPAISNPSTSALTDVLARLDALETQLQRLTAQTEVNSNQIRLYGERLDALEAANVPAPATNENSGELPREGAINTNLSQMTESGNAQPAGPTPERLAAVQEIAKPSTGDAGDDEYVYGFRLWDAGFYPEAQQQLARFVEAHPGHSRISYGRNLLGRAYLDQGKPREAASWFLQNYQADKQGPRAGDSLLYLGISMIALEDTERACIALAEFGETYPALASGRLQDQYEANRRKVNCN